MAPLPKRRHSTRRGGKRWAAVKKERETLNVCPQCNAPRIPHRVCAKCGYYDGRVARTVAK